MCLPSANTVRESLLTERKSPRPVGPIKKTLTEEERMTFGRLSLVASVLIIAGSPVASARQEPQSQDPRVNAVAQEFKKRLNYYQGSLLALTLSQQRVLVAKWTSKKCDYLEPEVIDLLISIHRGMPTGPGPKLIKGERTCSGKVNTYSLTGDRFRQYRTGQGNVNDIEVLKGIK